MNVIEQQIGDSPGDWLNNYNTFRYSWSWENVNTYSMDYTYSIAIKTDNEFWQTEAGAFFDANSNK